MAGELQLGGSTVATHTGSGASAVVTIDNGVKFPAGHIIQQDCKHFKFNGDSGSGAAQSSIQTAFGPVIPMTLKNQNARVLYIFTFSRISNTHASATGEFFLVGGTSAFTSSDFNSSHGASIIPIIGAEAQSGVTINNRILTARPNSTSHTGSSSCSGIAQVTNSANTLMYFSCAAQTGGNNLYWNYDGNEGQVTFYLAEIQV